MSPNLLVITTLLFAVSALAQTQCGSYVCSSTNQCCPDDVLGSVCYDPEMAKCLPTNLPSLNDANVAGARLCGANDSTCSLTCYDPKLYYCCNLRDLKQLGQPCDAATPAPPQPATTAAPMIQNNCPGAANTAGVNCSDASLCCGAGTMTPSCLPADGSQQCCTWYLSSTQCDTEEVCGGNLGYGASSSATCGPSGTIFCNKGDGINAFCQPDELCCGNYGQYAFCCPGSNSTCPTDYSFQCVYNQATSAPTAAPTSAPTEAPTSAPTEAPVMNNCPGAANTAGVNCSDASLCCGAGTMTPSCLPADGSQQCCTWYLSSTQCDPEEVCGGNLGYGASSQASCGPSGTTFCNKGDGLNAFCEQDEICCGNYGQYAFCCPQANSTCPTDYSFECVYASSPEAPTESPTSAPTDAPTASPTQAPMEYNCPAASANFGVNCSDASLCCGAGTISPSCLPEDGSKKCCQWYLSSAQCDSDEVCGGGLGVGASSYTTCGAPGTVFCNKGTGTNTYCAPTDLCCGNQGSFAFCCPGNNSTCPTNGSYGCVYSL